MTIEKNKVNRVFTMKMRKCGGFTLIEVLIVIAIAAIITGAMVPLMTVSREDARLARALSDLDSIKAATIALYRDTGQWPPTGFDGHGLIDNQGRNGLIKDWQGPYLNRWIKDPWNLMSYHIYEYTPFIGSPTQLRVRSYGRFIYFQTYTSKFSYHDCECSKVKEDTCAGDLRCDDVIRILSNDISR